MWDLRRAADPGGGVLYVLRHCVCRRDDRESGARAWGVPHGVVEAIDRGQLIEAIKIYRQAKRCSLKEAKDACDAIRHSRGRR